MIDKLEPEAIENKEMGFDEDNRNIGNENFELGNNNVQLFLRVIENSSEYQYVGSGSQEGLEQEIKSGSGEKIQKFHQRLEQQVGNSHYADYLVDEIHLSERMVNDCNHIPPIVSDEILESDEVHIVASVFVKLVDEAFVGIELAVATMDSDSGTRDEVG